MYIDIQALFDALARVIEQRGKVNIKFYLEERENEENSRG